MGTPERLNLAHSKQTHTYIASLTVRFMQIKNCNNINVNYSNIIKTKEGRLNSVTSLNKH